MYFSATAFNNFFGLLQINNDTGKKGREQTTGLTTFLALDMYQKLSGNDVLNLNPANSETRQSITNFFAYLLRITSSEELEYQVNNLGFIEIGLTSTKLAKKFSSNFLTTPLKRAADAAVLRNYPSRPAPLLNLGIQIDPTNKWGVSKIDTWEENIFAFLRERKCGEDTFPLIVFLLRNTDIDSSQLPEITIDTALTSLFTNELTRFLVDHANFPSGWDEFEFFSDEPVTLEEINREYILDELGNEEDSGQEENEQEEHIPHPKNLILYGPPGTGKTHKTAEITLKICGYWEERLSEDRKELMNRFQMLQKQGQVEFITFHQSFSYEEFVEGIRAIVVNDQVKYEVKDGVFKEICKKALNSPFSKGGLIEGYELVDVNEHLIYVKNSANVISPIPYDLVEEAAKNVLEDKITLEDIHTGRNKEITSQKYDNYILGYKSILKALVKHYIEKLKSVQSTDKNYVLIIDEINRANISKVFGELITLIEDDKRIGEGNYNSLRVKLPYSKEHFGVPKNLYIIGTMNTTDRSIALMDIALRRRFEYVEIMPDTTILHPVTFNDNQIEINKLLDIINKRITVLLDREHTIGQALFLNIHNMKDLVNAFRKKLIPLLQEYFYEDWEKISLVLGDNQKVNTSLKILIVDDNYNPQELFGNGDYVSLDSVVYTVNPLFGVDEELTFNMIKTIYQKQED